MAKINSLMMLMVLEALMRADDVKLNSIYQELTGNEFGWFEGELHVSEQDLFYEAFVIQIDEVKEQLQKMLELLN